MRAHELTAGQEFRVVGLSDTWVCLTVSSASVKVQECASIVRTFNTDTGDRIIFSFHRPPFYISRETSVEVAW